MKNIDLGMFSHLERLRSYYLKMKLTTLFLLVSLIKIQANTYGQNTRISLDMDNARMETVFNTIESLSEFRFLYNLDKIDVDRRVSIHAKKERISNILESVFDGTDIHFTVNNKVIILNIGSPVNSIKTQKPTNMNNIEVQDTEVSGTVTDDTGVPMPGVNVVEKGTSNGVSTDFDGNYTIRVSDGSSTLVFTYLGYADKEIVVGEQSTINITLEEDAEMLGEVVVTALGIKREAKALGYSVAKVDNERILASGTPANALQALYGTAAGVQIATTANGPTGGMRINIRNSVSLDDQSTTRPLFVVDGIPIFDEATGVTANARTGRDTGTGINDINPDDIASFEILKGAKASVLYGSEGANGVVLITTKSGQRGKGLGVSASFTTQVDEAAFLPNFQRQFGTGRTPSSPNTDDQGYFINPNGERALDFASGAFGPRYDPNVRLRWWDGSLRPWTAHPRDVFDQLFRSGRQNVTNVAVSSGGERGSMRFSYTNTDISPLNPGGDFNRHTFSLSSTFDINDNITLKYSGNYFITNNINANFRGSLDAQGAGTSIGAFSSDIDVDLIRRNLVTEDGFFFFANPQLVNFVSNGRGTVANAFWNWTQNRAEFNRIHNIQSLTMDVKLNDTFSLNLLGGLDDTVTRDVYEGKLEDPQLIGPPSGFVLSDRTSITRYLYGQGLLNFNTDINKDWGLSGFVGGAVRGDYFETKGAERLGNFVIPNFFSFANLPAGQQPVYEFDNGEEALYSALGSVQLDWKGQVYIEAQARNDWSSILPPDNNSFFYPGVSGTWILSNSFELPEVVKFLKLRTSWADVGRPGPRFFSNVNLGVSQSGSGFILNPPQDLPPVDLATLEPNLRPERKREYEIGLEAFLFENQRLGIDFSFYTNSIYDQIMDVPAPPGFGVRNFKVNAGEVSNTGWELALKTKPILTENFKWNANITFAQFNTRVEELFEDITSLSLWDRNGLNGVAEVGGEYGLIIQQQGFQNYINPSDDNDPNNGRRIVESGGQRYQYARSSNRRVGSVLPDVIGGVFNTFEYKNLRLTANLDYSFGATFISETETYQMASGTLQESLPFRDAATGGRPYYLDDDGAPVGGVNPNGGATFNDGVLLDGVLPNGEENTQVVPAENYYTQSYFSNGFFPQDRIFTGDYIALRNVALDYTVPNMFGLDTGLQSLVFSVFCNNAGFLYKDAPNSVPESTDGAEGGANAVASTALPLQRSIGMSVRVNF